MVYAVVVAVVILGVIHVINGTFSICLGVTSSIKAEIWLAHTVSPIWSGAFFLVTGLLGFACAKKKTAYMIMCFTAFSIVSLVTAIVSIQLLRLGLVNHTTDGNTFQKENKDVAIILALICAGFECLICLISSVVSCRMARAAKKELFRQQSELFHVQDEDEKKLEEEFANIATIQCANLHGDVMIPIDSRNAAGSDVIKAADVQPDANFSQQYMGGSLGFEPDTTTSEDRKENSFWFDSTEVLRRARIYAAQEMYKEKRRKAREKEVGTEEEEEKDSAQNQTKVTSLIAKGTNPKKVNNGIPFQSYSNNNNTSKCVPDISVQDLESSVSEYNLKDRMEVEVKLHDEKDVFGYRPHIPDIQEELERENSPIPMLSLDDCLTQRDIDLNLPNTMRSSRVENEATEMKELSARAHRKPESILKDRRNSSSLDSTSELVSDSSENGPNQQQTSKKRIRFQDEK